MLTRINHVNQHDSTLDVIALETKLEQDFNNRATFADGDWDARLGFEPSEESWLSGQYRRGYLAGIEAKYNEKFELI